jgi:membrane-bound lytic murein transglycosylase D
VISAPRRVATVQALGRANSGGRRFELLGVKNVRAFDQTVVLVQVAVTGGDVPPRLVGSSVGDDDLVGATVRAVLNASNRVLWVPSDGRTLPGGSRGAVDDDRAGAAAGGLTRGGPRAREGRATSRRSPIAVPSRGRSRPRPSRGTLRPLDPCRSAPAAPSVVPVSLRSTGCALALAALAACSGGPKPTVAPTPVAPPPVATGASSEWPAWAAVPTPAAAGARGAPVAPTVPVEAPHEHTAGAAWDLEVHPYEQHERVRHYVGVFTGPARGRFVEWLGRGTRYQPMILERLRAAGLPEDLYYLALVESGYEPHAVSHAGAVGMWQFMAPTARELGLRVDWWIDERRDPVRSTDGAARMLRWMRREFGSTFVAAAAYNGGPGRVSRGLTQLAANADSSTGDSRFFALSENALLRAETQNYVPQLIAAALVAKDTARYRLVARPRAPFAYDSVRVPALVPLAAVARAARATREELLDLNPQVLRGMTPPGGATLLRLPPGAADGFAARLATLDDDAVRRPFRTGVTRKRETLAALADRLDASPAMLEAFNPPLATVRRGRWKGRLVADQSVRVPTAAVRAYARGLTSGEAPGLPALPPAERAPERAPEPRLAAGKRARTERAERAEGTTTAGARLREEGGASEPRDRDPKPGALPALALRAESSVRPTARRSADLPAAATPSASKSHSSTSAKLAPSAKPTSSTATSSKSTRPRPSRPRPSRRRRRGCRRATPEVRGSGHPGRRRRPRRNGDRQARDRQARVRQARDRQARD